jgi:hypothetical protein
MPQNTFSGGEYVFQQLVVISVWVLIKTEGVSMLYVSQSWYNLQDQELLGALIFGWFILTLYICSYIYC